MAHSDRLLSKRADCQQADVANCRDRLDRLGAIFHLGTDERACKIRIEGVANAEGDFFVDDGLDCFGVEDFRADVQRVIVRGKVDKERLVPLGRKACAALEVYLQRGRPGLASKSRGVQRAMFLIPNLIPFMTVHSVPG